MMGENVFFYSLSVAVSLMGTANWDEALQARMLQRNQMGRLYRGMCEYPVGGKCRAAMESHMCIVWSATMESCT